MKLALLMDQTAFKEASAAECGAKRYSGGPLAGLGLSITTIR